MRVTRRNGSRWIPLVGLVLALALAGCGGSDDGDPENLLVDNPGVVVEPTFGEIGDLVDIESVCGDDEYTIALADGFGGNSWRTAMRAEFEVDAAKCPNVKTLYTDAQGQPQKAISDIRSLTARGADAIVIYGDAGETLLPAIKSATEAGVVVVPFNELVGGTAGTDFAAIVHATDDLITEFGRAYAEWMVSALDGTGNVVQLGGTPGNSFSNHVNEGIKEVFADNPNMKLLEGPVDTNWDVAQCQKVMAGLLTKYPKIDGVISDYGACAAAALRAFEAAGRPLPAITGDDQNVLACAWADKKGSNPTLQVAVGESRPWGSAAALRRALAVLNRVEFDEPTVIPYRLVGDSLATGSAAPRCDPDLPPDAFTASSMLPREKILELFG